MSKSSFIVKDPLSECDMRGKWSFIVTNAKPFATTSIYDHLSGWLFCNVDTWTCLHLDICHIGICLLKIWEQDAHHFQSSFIEPFISPGA